MMIRYNKIPAAVSGKQSASDRHGSIFCSLEESLNYARLDRIDQQPNIKR